MKIILLFVIAVLVWTHAYSAGPLFRHESPAVNQEFENVYRDLRASGSQSSVYPSTFSIGDMLYAPSTNMLTNLPRSTSATRYIGNTGTGNIPEWVQVNLSNGVSSTLPITNGGTGQDKSVGSNLVIISSNGIMSAGAATTTANYYVTGTMITISTNSTATSASTTGSTYVDSNLTATITIKSTTSIVAVTIDQTCVLSASGAVGGLKIQRAGSDIYGPFNYFFAIGAFHQFTIPITYYDKPATTGSVTYKTQMALISGGGSIICQDSFGGINTRSQIKLVEIAQ